MENVENVEMWKCGKCGNCCGGKTGSVHSRLWEADQAVMLFGIQLSRYRAAFAASPGARDGMWAVLDGRGMWRMWKMWKIMIFENVEIAERRSHQPISLQICVLG